MSKMMLQAKTPEEAFDRQMISGNYKIFLGVLLFLVVGVEMFVGLMSTPVCIGVAGVIASLTVVFLAAPLLWETGNDNRTVRRIRRITYFPINRKAFVFSKVKIIGLYGAIVWIISLLVQVLVIPLFGAGNILLYQGTLLVIGAINMVFYVVIGTVGARIGE